MVLFVGPGVFLTSVAGAVVNSKIDLELDVFMQIVENCRVKTFADLWKCALDQQLIMGV